MKKLTTPKAVAEIDHAHLANMLLSFGETKDMFYADFRFEARDADSITVDTDRIRVSKENMPAAMQTAFESLYDYATNIYAVKLGVTFEEGDYTPVPETPPKP